MAGNQTPKYSLSVVNGTRLQLSLSGPQGPAGVTGPNSITTSTDTNLTGFISGDGTKINGATAAASAGTANTLVLRSGQGAASFSGTTATAVIGVSITGIGGRFESDQGIGATIKSVSSTGALIFSETGEHLNVGPDKLTVANNGNTAIAGSLSSTTLSIVDGGTLLGPNIDNPAATVVVSRVDGIYARLTVGGLIALDDQTATVSAGGGAFTGRVDAGTIAFAAFEAGAGATFSYDTGSAPAHRRALTTESIVTEAADFNLSEATHGSQYTRLTKTGSTQTITLPTTGVTTGAEFGFYRATTESLAFSGGTVNGAANLASVPVNGAFALKYLGSGTYDFI
jgi:hypothetical protein